jgi:hypothetical protein
MWLHLPTTSPDWPLPPAVHPLRNAALRLLGFVPAFRRGLAEQLSAIGHR